LVYIVDAKVTIKFILSL